MRSGVDLLLPWANELWLISPSASAAFQGAEHLDELFDSVMKSVGK
jgi:hypothetical protein